MNEDLLEQLRKLMGQVPADATRAPVQMPARQTIGPAPSPMSQSRVPAPRRGLMAAVERSAQPSPDTPAGWVNETLNPIRAGAQARELVGEAVRQAGRGNIGRAVGAGAMAASMAPITLRPTLVLKRKGPSIASDWHVAGSHPHPMNDTKRVVESGGAMGSYEVAPSVTGEGYTIRSILSNEPGGGSATLRHLTEAADRANVPLDLTPEPFGSKKMSQQALIDWYQRYGFGPPEAQGVMRRMPRTVREP